METIKYKNLSGWLKLAIVTSYVIGVFYAIAFLYGFIIGLGL